MKLLSGRYDSNATGSDSEEESGGSEEEAKPKKSKPKKEPVKKAKAPKEKKERKPRKEVRARDEGGGGAEKNQVIDGVGKWNQNESKHSSIPPLWFPFSFSLPLNLFKQRFLGTALACAFFHLAAEAQSTAGAIGPCQ